MTSRSSSSKGLVRDGVRRSLWAVVLSTLTFFMSMLLPSLMEMQHALENRRDMIVRCVSFDVEQNWQWESFFGCGSARRRKCAGQDRGICARGRGRHGDVRLSA